MSMRIKFEVEVERTDEGLGVSRFCVFHRASDAESFRHRVAVNGGRIVSETPSTVAEALATLRG